MEIFFFHLSTSFFLLFLFIFVVVVDDMTLINCQVFDIFLCIFVIKLMDNYDSPEKNMQVVHIAGRLVANIGRVLVARTDHL